MPKSTAELNKLFTPFPILENKLPFSFSGSTSETSFSAVPDEDAAIPVVVFVGFNVVEPKETVLRLVKVPNCISAKIFV